MTNIKSPFAAMPCSKYLGKKENIKELEGKNDYKYIIYTGYDFCKYYNCHGAF